MKEKTKKILLRYGLIALITGILVGVDLLTKKLFFGNDKVLIYNFLTFETQKNDGAAMGIFSGRVELLIVVTFIFLILILLYDYFFKQKSILYFIGLNLILAGAVGNLVDRLSFGYVRDFIRVHIKIMPYCFNVADAFLTFGVIFMLICVLFFKNDAKNDVKIENNKELKWFITLQ